MHEYTKYFKERNFSTLINKLYEKYKSYGHISGTIKLENLSPKEMEDLSKLFGETITTTTYKTTTKKFLKIIENSKYTDFDVNTLVSEYLNKPLISNKEKNTTKAKEEQDFYQHIIGSLTTKGEKILSILLQENKHTTTIIHSKYQKDKHKLQEELNTLKILIDNLPQTKTLLSIYACTYAKDPHYLDLDKNNITLFLHALSILNNKDFPLARQDKIKLLQENNIEIDNISNFVITYNLLSNRLSINDFSQNKEPLILNITNIINTATFKAKNNQVFIFENPSILTEIISRNIDATIIISGGFPNVSVYLLLDKLKEANTTIYYNGDFDPEGLLIASKLKNTYSNLTLFCYDTEDYNACLSNKIILESRLKKLSNITTEELTTIKNLLLKNKLSAYQENNIARIIDYIVLKNK